VRRIFFGGDILERPGRATILFSVLNQLNSAHPPAGQGGVFPGVTAVDRFGHVAGGSGLVLLMRQSTTICHNEAPVATSPHDE
jgi:hypothetical protein